MRLSRTRWSLAAGIAVLGVFGIAAAQQGATPPSAIAPALIGQTGLSPQQQLSQAQGFLTRMEQAASTVRTQLEQAREARDVVKVLCLNDKLNQIDVAKRTTKDRVATLQIAVNGNDANRANSEFQVLQTLKERVETLIAEANQCVGEETGFIGETKVTVDIDPTIPDNDVAQLGSDPAIISIPPVLSSPTE